MISRKYAGDYRLDNITLKNGHIKTVPVYSGPRFRFRTDDASLVHIRRRFCAAALFALLTSVLGIVLNAPAAHIWYVILPLVLSLIALWFLLRALLTFTRVRSPMRREEKDRVEDIPPAAFAHALLAGLSAAGSIVYLFVGGFDAFSLIYTLILVLNVVPGTLLFLRRSALRMTEILPESGETA